MKIFALQLGITLCLCLLFGAFSGWIAAYSSFMGGVIFAIPQLYFGYKAYQVMGARSAIAIVQNFYKGESGKIVMVGTGFALAFALVKPLDFFALFLSFIIVLFVNAFLPAFNRAFAS